MAKLPAISSLEDPRFDAPLYTLSEAASIVGVPIPTLSAWTRSQVRRERSQPEAITGPLVTRSEPDSKAAPSLPFIGLVEAFVVAAVRRSGVPMQRIRPMLDALTGLIGVDHALASERLAAQGAEMLSGCADDADEATARLIRRLVASARGRCVFNDVVERHLACIEYAADGYASRVHLPTYTCARVVVDPTRSFGKPTLVRGGARVADVLDRFWTGESLAELEDEFGAPSDQLEDLLRVASSRAA